MSLPTWTPTRGRLLVSVDVTKPVSKSGLVLPESATKKNHATGSVAALGKCEQSMFAVGSTVLFGHFAGLPVEVDGVPYVVMHEDDVLLVK